jgi:succinate-semialdehyde dehydrogenase/glutarate-semialdehyde dehydrogenase
MTIESINPATEEVLATFEPLGQDEIERALSGATAAFSRWRRTSFGERSGLLRRTASSLRRQKERLAGLITAEMGKPIVEAEAEIEKCAWN